MLIVDDLLLNICIDWVICSCIHKCWVGCYIHVGEDEYFVFILATTECFEFILATINDTDVSW